MSLRGRLGVALPAGVALSFAFPSFDLAPLAWFALAIPLVLVKDRSGWDSARIWFAFGLGFFGALLVWISIVGWVAWALLVVLEALFLAGFGAAYATTRSGGAVMRVVAAPVLWVAIEYLRARVPLGGFTWGQLAQSQHGLTFMLKPAALGGGWLVAFIIMTSNAAIAEIVTSRSSPRSSPRSSRDRPRVASGYSPA